MKVVLVLVPTWAKLLLVLQAPFARWIWYCVAPVDAVHDSDTELDVVPVTVRPVGAGGGVVPPPVVPVTVFDGPDVPLALDAVTR